MATYENNIIPLQDGLHKPRPYHASPWGEFFLHHKSCTSSQYFSMKDKVEVKKEEVRKMIIDSSSIDLPLKVDLVFILQRLGLDYHYKKEIDELLCSIHDDRDDGLDLHTTALRFYLLRKQGYHISPDVFLKFIDDDGNILSNDTSALLSMYHAAHLRIHGEEILDNTITFTKNHLQFVIEHLEPTLAKEVRFALETPLFRRLNRLEAKHYIPIYEKTTTRSDTILEFAKVDFSILQYLYCEELKDLTLWWREFLQQTQLSFARDRMVELHFWMLGVFYEPQYSYSRIMLTKLVVIISIFDDLYDNYSTSEEGKMFTEAMERWDQQAAEQLPVYMKSVYINVLSTVKAIEEDLKLQNNKHVELIKKVVIHMAKSYYAEVKWRDESYVPAHMEEHLQLSVRSSACMQITNLGFMSMGDVATSEAIEWAFTYPKIIKAVCIIGRIGNDITSHEREQASVHVASTVQTCMKENGITIEQAQEKLKEIIEESWMNINEECFKPTVHPMPLVEKVVHLGRTMDFIYKREDAYTISHTLADTITALYVDSI